MNKKLVIYTAFWTPIFVIVAGVLLGGFHIPIDWSLADSFVSVAIYSGFTLSFKFQAQFIEFQRKKIFKFLGSHFFAGLLISAIWVSFSKVLLFLFIENAQYQHFFNNSIPVRIGIGMTSYFLITSFNYLFLYYDNYKEKLEHETALKNLLTEAELKNLKFQINPHFIFNALNSIASLTHISSEKAAGMTIKLADFMRSTLTNTQPFSSLEVELNHCRMYIDIEKIRFGNKFIFEEHVDASLLRQEVPSMILQPLFENAIKYGVYEALEEVKIILTIEKSDEMIKVSIENAFESGMEKHKGEGIGLTNITKRMQLLFQRDDLVKIEKEKNLFRISISFPLQNRLHDATNA